MPRGHLWIEGDNARNSNDSNLFGPVAAGLVEARVIAKLWPLREAGLVERKEPLRDRLVYAARSETPADEAKSYG